MQMGLSSACLSIQSRHTGLNPQTPGRTALPGRRCSLPSRLMRRQVACGHDSSSSDQLGVQQNPAVVTLSVK